MVYEETDRPRLPKVHMDALTARANESEGEVEEKPKRYWERVEAVDKVVLWGHDDVPDPATDAFSQALNWAAMAELVGVSRPTHPR